MGHHAVHLPSTRIGWLVAAALLAGLAASVRGRGRAT
jgi:hypothetical protein